MIDVKHKEDCCGCEACVQICPKKCIGLESDYQGFIYPVVNTEACINCGLCDKVCPIINKDESSHRVAEKLYAVKANDDNIRSLSSSGGFFTVLSELVLNKNGVVYGVAFDNAFNVEHIRVENFDELSKLRGSKYVQSRIGESFKKCKEDLEEDRYVLFSGTPCQISALGLFLKKEYDKLIKVEVVCHGVPSRMVYQHYLKETVLKDVRGREITKVNFRTKLNGWRNYYFTVEYKDGDEKKLYKESVSESLYMKGFLNDLYIRPSCFKCPAKNFSSGADFTIADFWGQEYTFPDFDNDSGVSAAFLNTFKAKGIFNKCRSSITFSEKQYEEFIKHNPSLVKSAIKSKRYERFWELYKTSGVLTYSISKICHTPLLLRILNKVMLLYKIGIGKILNA